MLTDRQDIEARLAHLIAWCRTLETPKASMLSAQDLRDIRDVCECALRRLLWDGDNERSQEDNW